MLFYYDCANVAKKDKSIHLPHILQNTCAAVFVDFVSLSLLDFVVDT